MVVVVETGSVRVPEINKIISGMKIHSLHHLDGSLASPVQDNQAEIDQHGQYLEIRGEITQKMAAGGERTVTERRNTATGCNRLGEELVCSAQPAGWPSGGSSMSTLQATQSEKKRRTESPAHTPGRDKIGSPGPWGRADGFTTDYTTQSMVKHVINNTFYERTIF